MLLFGVVNWSPHERGFKLTFRVSLSAKYRFLASSATYVRSDLAASSPSKQRLNLLMMLFFQCTLYDSRRFRFPAVTLDVNSYFSRHQPTTIATRSLPPSSSSFPLSPWPQSKVHEIRRDTRPAGPRGSSRRRRGRSTSCAPPRGGRARRRRPPSKPCPISREGSTGRPSGTVIALCLVSSSRDRGRYTGEKTTAGVMFLSREQGGGGAG